MEATPPDAWLTAELLLRGIAVGALISNGVAFFRAGANPSMQTAGALFFVSIIGYAFNSSHFLRPALGEFGWLATSVSLGGGGFFWLFVVTLFQDQPLSWQRFVPAAALTLLGIVGLVAVGPWRNGIWIFHNVIEISLALHALYVIHDSWRGDLVEARRRLRGPFLGVVSIYAIALSGVEIGESVGVAASWYSLVGGALLAAFCVAGNLMFLRVNASVFGATVPVTTASAERTDPADRITLDKLTIAMDQGVWRDDGLSIGTLAEKVGVPEHRLRRLINDNLGHRNFAAFVNARRIDEAKRTLGDPEKARMTVAAIAFELGFGSIGPFNRAFKDVTGQTPSQWRKAALEKALPNSDIVG